MAMSLKVIVPPHPLIKHWLSILREKNSPNILYSTGYEQLGKWLSYEALGNSPNDIVEFGITSLAPNQSDRPSGMIAKTFIG